MKQKTKRLLSLLLAMIMLVTAQGFTIFADTVSENEVQSISAEGETDSGQAAMAKGTAAPVNPVHYCVNNDFADCSYIYFGSYPQGEVTDETIIAAIDSAIAAGNTAAGADEIETEDAETAGVDTDVVETVGIDVELDGVKYRRISKDDTNYDRYFDNMENNGYRYFKWESIKWRVLNNNDDGTLFVMADSVLDCKCYNDEKVDITWENSTIRSWLNGSFYQSAFSSAEQNAITPWHVVNEDNPFWVTEGGNDTTDYVYLLSIGEVTDERYGFCNINIYNKVSASRRLHNSEYAHARGAYRSTGASSGVTWWLRSPGSSRYDAAYVNDDGYVSWSGGFVNDDDFGAVPVLHINLSSNLWLVVDDGSSGEGTEYPTGENPVNPVHHCETKADDTDFSYVYFGSYPQDEVTDSETIAAIDSAVMAGNEVAATDGAGVDVLVNSTKYRKISKDATNYGGYFDNVENNGYRYFKWEPIKWRVLDSNDNGSLFVMVDKAIDCKNYNDEYTSTTWENSTIRSWLNGSFYQSAFSSAEQNAITPWYVVNEDNTRYGTEGGNDTTDHVYLLSMREVTDERYGFCSNDDTSSASRRLQTSKYAHARGAEGDFDSRYGTHCRWRLRSPGDSSYDAAYVYSTGDVYRSGIGVSYNRDGVVPALHIDLSSDLWSVLDDGTSGDGGGTPTGGNQNPSNPQPEPSKPEPSKPADLQPTGTSLTASQVTSRTDTVPQGASFTVTSSDPANPTVSFDGVSDENAAAVTIPKTITCNGVEYKVTTVSPTAFSTKKDNASFTVTDNRVESLTVEYKAPSNTKKTKVTVPETTTYKGIKFKVTSIAAKSFKNNKKVKQVSVAGSVTKIGDSSFEGCTSLKSVTLGKGASTIGKNAFKNCKKLTKITIKSKKLKTVGKNALKGINAKCKIKVPVKQLKKYQKLFKKKGQKNSVKLVK